MRTDTEWNWNSPAAKEDIVVKPVQAIAVYANSDDEIVIRQAGAPGTADSVITVPKVYARGLMQGIQSQLAQDVASYQVFTAAGNVLDANLEGTNNNNPVREPQKTGRWERLHKDGVL